ncbi:MAG: hypothetical protein R3C32_03650 [Chloroflexota bacterium]
MHRARVYRMWTGPMAQLAPLAILAFVAAFPVSLLWHARRGRMARAVRIATADALLVASVLVILRATLPSDLPPSGLDPWTWVPFEDLIRAWPFDRSRGAIRARWPRTWPCSCPSGWRSCCASDACRCGA